MSLNSEAGLKVMDAQAAHIVVIAKPGILVDGLCARLTGDPTRHISRIAATGVNAAQFDLNRLQRLNPQVILFDERALGEHPATRIRQLRAQTAGARLLVFGRPPADADLLLLIKAGADGYVTDTMTGADLSRAIAVVMRGELFVQRRILSQLTRLAVEVNSVVEDAIVANIETLGKVLTRREQDVYRFIMMGFATKEIASTLHMSEQCVKLYLTKIFRKFEVHNRQHLILSTFQKICPVNDLMRLIRVSLERRCLARRYGDEKPPARAPGAL